jgi:hypothetical protein
MLFSAYEFPASDAANIFLRLPLELRQPGYIAEAEIPMQEARKSASGKYMQYFYSAGEMNAGQD